MIYEHLFIGNSTRQLKMYFLFISWRAKKHQKHGTQRDETARRENNVISSERGGGGGGGGDEHQTNVSLQLLIMTFNVMIW